MEHLPSLEQDFSDCLCVYIRAKQDCDDQINLQPSFNANAADLFCDKVGNVIDQWHYKAESAIKHAIIQLKADACATTLSALQNLATLQHKTVQTAVEKQLEQVLKVCNRNLQSALAKIRKLSRQLKDMRATVSMTYLSLLICLVNCHFAF